MEKRINSFLTQLNTLEDFRRVTNENGWKSLAKSLLISTNLPSGMIKQFATYWIEGGYRICEQIADDRTLTRLLRHMLLPYNGPAVILYRGESIERWESRIVGFAWTTDIEVAKMFARGLNSIPIGGVLLQGQFQIEAVISGPNAHSKYLSEEQFTIDPFDGGNIMAIEKFPASL
jgi:hypothetical protein